MSEPKGLLVARTDSCPRYHAGCWSSSLESSHDIGAFTDVQDHDGAPDTVSGGFSAPKRALQNHARALVKAPDHAPARYSSSKSITDIGAVSPAMAGSRSRICQVLVNSVTVFI